MAGMSTYLQGYVANLIASKSLVVALSMGDPSADGSTLNEPAGGYSRQPVTVTVGQAVSGQVSGGTKITVTSTIVFGPAAGSGWGSVTHGLLMDTAGNIYCTGPLGAAKAPPVGDTISFGSGAIQFVLR